MDILVNTIPVDYNNIQPKPYYPISAGILVINVSNDGTFTETMKRYLSAIVFKFYNKLENDEYIIIDSANLKWDTKQDMAIMLDEHHTPKETYIGFEIVLDKTIFDLKDSKGNPLYPDAKDITEFPIEIAMI